MYEQKKVREAVCAGKKVHNCDLCDDELRGRIKLKIRGVLLRFGQNREDLTAVNMISKELSSIQCRQCLLCLWDVLSNPMYQNENLSERLNYDCLRVDSSYEQNS